MRMVGLVLLGLSFLPGASPRAEELGLSSPDGRLRLIFSLREGRAGYALERGAGSILAPSCLGLTFAEGGPLRWLRLVGEERREVDATWKPVWGTAAEVRDRFRELAIDLEEEPRADAAGEAGTGRRLRIVFRAYDEGIAFRYEIPAQPGLESFALLSEETEFRFTADHRTWWIPADEFAYESLHRETPLSAVTHIHTPVTMETEQGLWLSLHEAALLDYSEMTLERTEGLTLRAHLWPWPDGPAVRGRAPSRTPWRTLQVADRAGVLAESHLIQNLNDPCAIEDASWIRPTKFVGIWWGMHTGAWTWHAGPRHGATTERAKAYVDFAARHGIEAVLAEGWNLGWETWGRGESLQDYCTPYPDFDLEEVVRYARERGVAWIAHHETGGHVPMYERQMEAAFALCERLGIPAVKTGYAGPIAPEGMHHHGQWMVNHFQRVVETAARHRVMLDVHEGIKPTGLERTWPNLMTTEAIRGMEWNATLHTNPPRHETILPFTRFLAGPADATPGIFALEALPGRGPRVASTLARQLALYVVCFSPLAMAADRIESYEGHPAFRFVEQVPCSWDETRVIDARPGDQATFARRSGESWFVGGVADEEVREAILPLAFLESGRVYRAELYADAPGTDWERAPGAIEIGSYRACSADTLRIILSRAGGFALRLSPEGSPGVAERATPGGSPHEGAQAAGDLPAIDAFNATAEARRLRFEALSTPGDVRSEHLAVGASLQLAAPPSPKYALGSLTDGRLAWGGFQDERWLGFEGVDLGATLDLGSARRVSGVSARLCHDPGSWILLPRRIRVEASVDGRDFEEAGVIEPVPGDRAEIRALALVFAPREARYLRVSALQRPLPPGHPGFGRPGWIFCDEIEVR